jgi:hypothetical protein
MWGCLILSLVCGHSALSQIRSRRLAGRPWAIAGLTAGYLVVLFFAFSIVTAMFHAPVGHTQVSAQDAACINNLQRLAIGIRMYGVDNDDRMPPAAKWCDAIKLLASPSDFQCPKQPDQRCAFAFNAKLDGKKQSDVHPLTVMLFESDAGWNGSGGASILKPHSHSTAFVSVVLADGTWQRIPRSQLDTLRWDP